MQINCKLFMNGHPYVCCNHYSGDFDNSLKYYQEAYNHSDFYSYEWEHDRYIAHHILGENVEDYIENYI